MRKIFEFYGVDLLMGVEVEEVPLSYLPSSAVRVRVKAIGDLEFT